MEFPALGWKMFTLILGLKGLFIILQEHTFEVWKYRGRLSITNNEGYKTKLFSPHSPSKAKEKVQGHLDQLRCSEKGSYSES